METEERLAALRVKIIEACANREPLLGLLDRLDAAARERPSALDVERLLHAADIALGVQEVARQAGNADLFAALEPLRHAVRAARLTEPDAGEGTER